VVAYRLRILPRIANAFCPTWTRSAEWKTIESREKGLLTLNFYAVFCALEMLQSGSGRTGDYQIDVLPHSLGDTGNQTQCKGLTNLIKDTPPYGDFR
jgi:hypothetical protein